VLDRVHADELLADGHLAGAADDVDLDLARPGRWWEKHTFPDATTLRSLDASMPMVVGLSQRTISRLVLPSTRRRWTYRRHGDPQGADDRMVVRRHQRR